MPAKIPFKSLLVMYVEQRTARSIISRWYFSPPSFIIRPDADSARNALAEQNFFPWGERIYEVFKKEIETTYKNSPSALYLNLDLDRLVLVPVEVRGAEIDWSKELPESEDDFFSPPLLPSSGTLPETIAPPPQKVVFADGVTVYPLIEEVRYYHYRHPSSAAADEALSQLLRERFTGRELSLAVSKAYNFNLKHFPPLNTFFAFLTRKKKNDRVRDVFTRHWEEIMEHVNRGETAVTVLPEGLGVDYLATTPAPEPKEPKVLTLSTYKVMTTTTTLEEVVEDLVVRGEMDPRATRFVMVLRKERPYLREKLAYIENRYPNSTLIADLKKLLALSPGSTTHDVILVDLGPDLHYKLSRGRFKIADTGNWQDDFYEPPSFA